MIETVTDDGKLLVLGDGSVWEVSVVDSIHSVLWLPTDHLLICAVCFIHQREGKTIRVIRFK